MILNNKTFTSCLYVIITECVVNQYGTTLTKAKHIDNPVCYSAGEI